MSTLRERIAALQQRSSSPSTQQFVSAKILGTNEGKTLKDKIATFEKRGGTPIPRSSFGLAPPTQGKPSSREMYGNRFTTTSMPLDPSMTRSNSTRSVSPVPNPKRERRVSSYGDSSWGGPIRHQRSFSTAGDNLVPMHTGTTSSDEVSSITSSFPTTPRDGNSSFLKYNEVFQEDPDDNFIPSVPEDGSFSLPPRNTPSPNFDAFQKAYGKFTSLDKPISPTSPSERHVTLLSNSSDNNTEVAENELPPPNIVVNGMPEASTPAISGSLTALDLSSAEAASPTQLSHPSGLGGDTQRFSTRERNATITDSSKSTNTVSEVQLPWMPPRGKAHVTEQVSEKPFIGSVQTPSSPSPAPSGGAETQSSSPPPLRPLKSQSSLRKLSPLKPPPRPISASLSTPEIMAQFPPVPFAVTPASNDKVTTSASNNANSTGTNTSPATTTTVSATSTVTASTAPSSSPPAKKPNPKSLIPGWWDYNSDDEQEGGWATVIVSTRNS